MEYKFKTTPFKHQLDVFNKTKDMESFGLFWEQGCGKTKPIIDTASYLYLESKINALLVVAPKGVHVNWISDEIPAHMPDNVRKNTRMLYYESVKANTKTFKRNFELLIKHSGFSVLAINYDAFVSEKGKSFIREFLDKRNCMYVLDESHNIKSESAKRTKVILKSSSWASYRRILTGTPISVGPFDLYPQVMFLSRDFWKDRRLGNFFIFKRFFGMFKKQKMWDSKSQKNRTYEQLLCYKNLDIANGYFDQIGDRLTKEDANLNLPPKLFSKAYFSLSKRQSQLYTELSEEFSIDFEDNFIDASMALTRLIRAQQIICGYLPNEDGGVIEIEETNARLKCLQNLLEGIEHKVIIWARFTKDVDNIMKLLGDRAVRHDGQLNDEQEKLDARNNFQNGDKQFFVANPQGNSTGFTLTSAKTVVYYSNSFKLIDRLQSEDRAHRYGQKNTVNYIDICTEERTVDYNIIESLRNKINIASSITGDKLKEWL
jgi:SNF2 family DNA or RNA helicase